MKFFSSLGSIISLSALPLALACSANTGSGGHAAKNAEPSAQTSPSKEGQASNSPTSAKRAPAEDESENTPHNELANTGRTFDFSADFQAVQLTRQLTSIGEVDGRLLSPQALLSYVQGLVGRDIPEQVLNQETRLLRAFGIFPHDLDRITAELSLLDESLQGLYDPHVKTLLIRTGLDPGLAKLTILHELTHALQDQHFHLENAMKWEADASDRRSALLALGEGDALLTMVAAIYAQGNATFSTDQLEPIEAAYDSSQLPEDNAVPKVLLLSMMAPYQDGLRFVRRIYEEGGFAALNQVWANPPRTTQELLHPELYPLEQPRPQVELPTSISSYKRSYSDVLGEQGLRILLESHLPHSDATRGAAGWLGDRVGLYERPLEEAPTLAAAKSDEGDVPALGSESESKMESVAVLRIFFDSAAEEAEFAEIYRSSLNPEQMKAQGCSLNSRSQGLFLSQSRRKEFVIVHGPFLQKEDGTSEPQIDEAACERLKKATNELLRATAGAPLQ